MEALFARIESQDVLAEDIPVACVTRQFADYLVESQDVDLDAAGDFLRAAARLLLMKSEGLLPQPQPAVEHEGPEKALEAIIDRDGLYFAVRRLAERQGLESFGPERRESPVEPRFEPRPPRLLLRAWAELQKRQAAARVRVSTPAFVRLEVALSRLLRRLQSRPAVSLGRVLGEASRQDAVVHFLAVLELVRRGQARASQRELFDDITIERVEGGREPASRAG